MAATQSNLHQFYKTKKSARDISNAKNAKNTILRVPEAKVDEVLTPNVRVNTTNTSNKECTSQLQSIIKPSPGITKTQISQKTTLKKSSSRKERPAGTQDIAAVFERVAAKRKRQDDEDEVEITKEINSENSETVHATPPVTPKRKKEKDEEEKRKRRKEANEDGLDRTPSGSENVSVLDAPKSAKKKLIMGEESMSESTKEQEQSLIQSGSPRKLLSPKKLTPAEIKERLGRCGRLDQLRAKLLKVNKCEEKLKQFKENTIAEQCRSKEYQSPSKIAPHPQLEKFSALDVEVPVSSPKKTPIKTPSKTPAKAPAHERFQHLVEKPSEELVLPYKYRFVKEVFRAVDTVVSLLHNRQEVITFSKLKPAVQEMLRKTLHEHHLGEIKTVFPLAYLFKQELAKNTGKSGANNGYKSPYELTVAANMEYKTATQNLLNKFDSQPQTPKFRKMDSIVMVERRNIFHNSLINILREHHTDFLKSLDPPILNCTANIKRWHPAFPLEDVPDIEPSQLPQPPLTEKHGTAQDILNKAQELFSVNPRLEKAVADAAAKTPQKEAHEPAPPQPVKPTDIAAALKGVSSSLLEKIRAREAAKAARDMTRTSSENKELEMLSRLPEISRIMRNIFITEKKAALPWDLVATKVSASYPSMMASNEVDSHLNLLIKEVPGWCTVHNVRSGVFLKINKNEPQSNINAKLEAVINQRR